MNNDERCDKLSENPQQQVPAAWTIGLEERHRDEYKHERIPTMTQATVQYTLLAGSDLVVSPRRSIVFRYEILSSLVWQQQLLAAGGTEVAPNPAQNVKSNNGKTTHQCSFTSTDGWVYDLSPLTKPDGVEDYHVRFEKQQYSLTLNICSNVDKTKLEPSC